MIFDSTAGDIRYVVVDTGRRLTLIETLHRARRQAVRLAEAPGLFFGKPDEEAGRELPALRKRLKDDAVVNVRLHWESRPEW